MHEIKMIVNVDELLVIPTLEHVEGVYDVTELIYCIRKSFFRRKGFAPTVKPATPAEVRLAGKVLHETFKYRDAIKEIEFYLDAECCKIRGIVDAISDTEFIEFKTGIKKLRKPEDIPECWLNQIDAYSLLSGRSKCYLIYFNRVTGEKTGFSILIGEDDRERIKTVLMSNAIRLCNALKNDEAPRIPSVGVPAYSWECREEGRTKKYCEYYDLCYKDRLIGNSKNPSKNSKEKG
jgi:CRISPR/Cas system-associated exonuclease Cas4 (RecB family)